MWQMGGFGPMPGQVHHFIALENETGPRLWPEALHGRDAPALWRAGPAACGPRIRRGALSVADFAILGWAWRHPRHKVELKDFPNVERWYNALMARPATKRGMEAKLD